MARLEGYAFSDGTSKFRAVNSLVIEEQPSSPATTTARLASPAVFSTALTSWATILNATTPAGVYAITYDSSTRRVTIASTNAVNFRPDWSGPDAELALWLGFDPLAAYGFATSHVGTAIPLGRVDLLGVELEAPEDAAKVNLQQVRLGRAVAAVFGNHQLSKAGLVIGRNATPSSWAWLTTGRVRLYPTADNNPYSASNLDGYLDGYVVEQPGWEQLGVDEGLAVLQLQLALPRG